MSKGVVPPLQLYPTEEGNLEMEVQDETGEQYFARATLSRQQVKHLISMLQDWYGEAEKDELLF
jgi:hypothetical protein